MKPPAPAMAAVKRRGFCAATLLALHLLAVAMAMSPMLPHWLHHDDDAADHQCIATSLLNGQIDQSSTPDLDSAEFAPRVELCSLRDPAQPGANDLFFTHAGRAPPAA